MNSGETVRDFIVRNAIYRLNAYLADEQPEVREQEIVRDEGDDERRN